jgi:hypothetical protein
MVAYSEGGEGKMNLGWPLTNGTVAGRSINAEGAEARLRTISPLFYSFVLFVRSG